MQRLTTLALTLAALAGCDYTGDFLFAGEIEGVPGVIDLGTVIPSDPTDATAVQYAEVGPAPVGSIGGATLRFEGTGGSVCVWVDPEGVTWNTDVGPSGNLDRSYPDNVFDDGDLDLEVGQSIFYTGSVGESVGDFEVTYLDELGNDIRIGLNECTMINTLDEPTGHAGRAFPEYCTIANTVPNLEYTVAISTWTTPLDDDILSFGVVVADADCDALKRQQGVTVAAGDECLIRDEARADGVVRERFSEFEQTFCWMDDDEAPDDAQSLYEFCLFEAALIDCNVESCFCGDPTDLPEPL